MRRISSRFTTVKYNLYGKTRTGQPDDQGRGKPSPYPRRSAPRGHQGRGNVPLIVITSQPAHQQVIGNMIFNHYSLLGAIEQLWGWDAWRIRVGWPVWMCCWSCLGDGYCEL